MMAKQSTTLQKAKTARLPRRWRAGACAAVTSDFENVACQDIFAQRAFRRRERLPSTREKLARKHEHPEFSLLAGHW